MGKGHKHDSDVLTKEGDAEVSTRHGLHESQTVKFPDDDFVRVYLRDDPLDIEQLSRFHAINLLLRDSTFRFVGDKDDKPETSGDYVGRVLSASDRVANWLLTGEDQNADD